MFAPLAIRGALVLKKVSRAMRSIHMLSSVLERWKNSLGPEYATEQTQRHQQD